TSQNKISRRLSLIDALPPSSKNRQLPEVLQSLDTRSFVKKDTNGLPSIQRFSLRLLQAYPKKTATLLKYINEVGLYFLNWQFCSLISCLSISMLSS
ncbi:hypothetical protein HAX54_041452, partial [Datura stramonium]|nr:hypothetical protein [Datura stramonium]